MQRRLPLDLIERRRVKKFDWSRKRHLLCDACTSLAPCGSFPVRVGGGFYPAFGFTILGHNGRFLLYVCTGQLRQLGYPSL